MPPLPDRTKKKPLRAVGVTCGIGSMLVGAKQAGFQVVGNIEWRGYYHKKDSDGRNTFTENFPGAFMVKAVKDLSNDQLANITGCDLAIGHPECGLYSKMQACNNFRIGRNKGARTIEEKTADKGDIPLFLDLIAQIRPRFFVMDDLPKSFLACPMEEYTSRLSDYDLFPEWVSNWHYGNIQKKRVRMFMIGSLKSEGWVFTPGEFDHNTTLKDVIGDLPVDPIPGAIPNHDPHSLDEYCGRGIHMDYPGHRPTYGDYKRWMSMRPEGAGFLYHSPHLIGGGVKKKPGWYKQRWNSHCHVLDGGSGHTHPLTNLPFTIRERARIQGFPDDFIFYATHLNDQGEWNHERNIPIVRQTGKAMPIQFCRYVSSQIAAHIRGVPFKSSGVRFARTDKYVDEAKRWFCSNIGYSDQSRACSECWMESQCEIRRDKYGMVALGTSRVVQETRVESRPTPRPKPV
jgi:site-specific DNA-cytosine methylase